MKPKSELDVPQGELRRLEQSNLRLLSALRLFFAACTVAIVLAHGFGATTKWPLLVLLAYCAYSVLAIARVNRERTNEDLRHAHWIDAACYLAVLGLSDGGLFAMGALLLFPVVVASFHFGWQRGVRVASVCAISFGAIGVLHAWLFGGSVPLVVSLYSAALLFGAGVAVASWSNSEFTLRRHFAILNDLNSLAHPHRGLEWTLCELAEMLRVYQYADSFIVVMGDPDSGGYLFCGAGVRRTAHSTHIKRINADIANPLLGTTPEVNFLFSRRRHFWQRTIATAYDRTNLSARPAVRTELEQIANMLETDSFVALALHGKRRAVGRVYAASRRHRLLATNLAVLQQVVNHAALVIENVELLERLTTEVAMNERHKISGDLHDGMIQPYIGLKMAIDALRLKVLHDSPIAADVDDLARMTTDGIAELRRYVSALREKEAVNNSGESLVVAVRREAAKFSRFFATDVQVVASTDMVLNEAVLHEVSSIVKEGLANIRRHTVAKHAVIYLLRAEERIILQFVNDGAESSVATVFSPVSLNERASQLGGSVRVEQHDDGRTSVSVAIPVY